MQASWILLAIARGHPWRFGLLGPLQLYVPHRRELLDSSGRPIRPVARDARSVRQGRWAFGMLFAATAGTIAAHALLSTAFGQTFSALLYFWFSPGPFSLLLEAGSGEHWRDLMVIDGSLYAVQIAACSLSSVGRGYSWTAGLFGPTAFFLPDLHTFAPKR